MIATSDTGTDHIARNLGEVRQRLAAAARRAGRAPDAVSLVAVSKTFGPEAVVAAAQAGQRVFGENRVQEALTKMPVVAAAGHEVSWHLIGHLQSNKARRAATAFACIQSIDSIALLQAVDRAAADAGRTIEVLVQVDLAGELTKFGAPGDRVRPLIDAALECQAAQLIGLMILPPWFDDPELARPYFRQLAELRDTLESEGVPAAHLRELSMGMSHDFEVAVEEGSTIVRVGTAIFGRRNT